MNKIYKTTRNMVHQFVDPQTGEVDMTTLAESVCDELNGFVDGDIPDVQIADSLVQENERMLTDGFYAEVTLAYDPIVAQEKNGRPFQTHREHRMRDAPGPG